MLASCVPRSRTREFVRHHTGVSSVGPSYAYACHCRPAALVNFFFLPALALSEEAWWWQQQAAHPTLLWDLVENCSSLTPSTLGLTRAFLRTQLAFPRNGRNNQRFGARSQSRAVCRACLAWGSGAPRTFGSVDCSPHTTHGQRSLLGRRAYACDTNTRLVTFFFFARRLLIDASVGPFAAVYRCPFVISLVQLRLSDVGRVCSQVHSRRTRYTAYMFGYLVRTLYRGSPGP